LIALRTSGTLAAMATDIETLFEDLKAEGDELDGLVSGLSGAEWTRQTPAPRWTIAHQIAHLVWTDERTVLAVTDRAAFRDEVGRVLADIGGRVDKGADEGAALPVADLLARWRSGRAAVLDALRGVDPATKIEWFGPPMSPASVATARLMETWAHGLDIAETLGMQPPVTPRLWHIAWIGARTRDHAFTVNHLTPPSEPFRVELIGPCGMTWSWGPADAACRVSGPVLDFCLLVTQRRHRADTALVAVGAEADQWLDIAQAFAGPPGAGREPGQFG